MSNQSIESLVRSILKDMNSGQNENNENLEVVRNSSNSKTATLEDYPISVKHPEWVKTPSGKTLDDITLKNVLNGSLTAEDLKISPNILKAQGEIATSAGRKTISRNFARAAELTSVPDKRLLEMYNALRPYRSSKKKLLDIADDLENKYNAKINANYFREAAEQYEKRKKLKGDN